MSASTAEAQGRVPAGVKAGGQYATSTRAEPPVALKAAATRPTHDENGFPTVVCGRCHGSGRSSYSRELKHDRCFVCSGHGYTYERGLVADTVREFAKAQMEASRPRVRQLRKGDLVSQVYHELGRAKWARVESVLVYPSRPVRFEGEGDARRAVEYEATVQLSDGTMLRTTTNAVVARRGAQIDPAPYLQHLQAAQQSSRQRRVLTTAS